MTDTMKGDNILFVVYVHITPNNKLYFGISKNIKNRWRNDGIHYKTQQLFWRAIQKYGWDNIQHIILIDNLSKEIACECEKYLIAKYQTTNPKYGYNISTGGEGPSGVKRSKETREKLRLANLGHIVSEETRVKISKNSPHYNKDKKLSAEHKEKLHNSRRGKPSWNSGKKLSIEYRKKLSESHKGQKAWNKGIPGSDEMKQKVSLANKGKPSWNKGKTTPKKVKKQISESLKNRLWVNNGKHRTLIHQEELQTYLDNGYILGRGHKNDR